MGPWEELDVMEEVTGRRKGRESLEIFELETGRSVLSKAVMLIPLYHGITISLKD